MNSLNINYHQQMSLTIKIPVNEIKLLTRKNLNS